MRIIELAVENIGKLKAIAIRPSKNMVVIGGRNDQGKTTVLQSIMMAMCGQKAVWEKAVREGQERGKITVNLGDLIATLKITKDGDPILSVTSAEGAKYPSPQAMLNKLTGGLSFDPLEFSRLEGPKQVKRLETLVGIDLSGLDVERKATFDERTIVNRDVEALSGQLKGAIRHDDAPAAEVSIQSLIAKLESANTANLETEKLFARVKTGQTEVGKSEAEIVRLRQLLTAEEQRCEAMKTKLKNLIVEAESAKLIDVAPIKLEVSGIEQTNRKVRDNFAYQQLSDRVRDHAIASQKLTDQIEAIDADKIKRITAAKFPVEGLSFGELGVLYQGIPFAQLSGAQQLRISFGIWLGLNPKLRVVLINNGSELDEDNLNEVAAMAERHDVQVWMVRVSRGAECSIIIEGGEVSETHGVVSKPANVVTMPVEAKVTEEW